MRSSGKIVVVLVLAVAGALVLWWQNRPAPEPAPEAVTEAPPAVPVEATTAPNAPQALSGAAPEFDVVRITPEGQTVIAGHAAPGQQVEVVLDGKVIGSAAADVNGEFAAVLEIGPSAEPRELVLRVPVGDGQSSGAAGTAQAEAEKVEAARVAEEKAEAERIAEANAEAARLKAEKAEAERIAAEAAAAEAERAAAETQKVKAERAATKAAAEQAEAKMAETEPQASEASQAERVAAEATQAEADRLAAEQAVAEKTEAERLAAKAAEADKAPEAAAEAARLAAETAGAERLAAQAAEAEAARVAAEKAEAERLAVAEIGGSAEPAVPQFNQSTPVIILPQADAESAPLLVKPGPEGVTLLQLADTKPVSGIRLDRISYADQGDLIASGRGPAGVLIRVYVNAELKAEIQCNADGQWEARIPQEIAQSAQVLRFDEISTDGIVLSRLETPFDYSPVASVQEVRQRKIVVQKGDYLWKFAQQYYGEGLRYSVIFSANSKLIRDPDLIYPGQVFTVPELVNSQ
jgi:nucleoid-associated protein YgaU